MMMKKLAIASAVAMMGMGSAYAQFYSPTTVTVSGTSTTTSSGSTTSGGSSTTSSTTTTPSTTTTTQAETAGGLMSALSNSVGSLFNAGRPLGGGLPGVYEVYTGTGVQLGQAAYILDTSTGRQRLATPAEISAGTNLLFQAQAPVSSVLSNPVDISALGGAVNLAKINGSIDISGTNVTLSGVTGALAGLSTTVIGAMNSSTLDIAKSILTQSDMSKSMLNIAGLANQGAGPSITTQGFGPGQLGSLASVGTDLLTASTNTTQFNLTGLTSSTETLSSKVNDKLQTMNVMQMAVNMAPLEANVKIAAALNPDAWFLGPQTGVVSLSGLQVATTTIGAMNSSITRLGAKLSN